MNKQQRQKMAKVLVQEHRRETRAGVSGVSKQVAKAFDAIIKLAQSIPGSKVSETWEKGYSPGPRHMIHVRWENHLVLKSLSIQQDIPAVGGEDQSYTAMIDLYSMPEIQLKPVGMGFNLKTLSFFFKKLSFVPSSQSEVSNILKVLKSDLKAISQLTDIVDNEGMEVLKVKKEDFLKKQEKQWTKNGLNVVPVSPHDEDRYKLFLRKMWALRLEQLARKLKLTIKPDSFMLNTYVFENDVIPADIKMGVSLPAVTDILRGTIYYGIERKHTHNTESGTGFDPVSKRILNTKYKDYTISTSEGEAAFSLIAKSFKELIQAFVKAKSTPDAPPPEKGTFTHSDVRSTLKSMKFGPAGKARLVDNEGDGWSVEPQYRKRLDHFGNDGDGWDEEGWEEEYAEPVREATLTRLESAYGKGNFYVDVGDKGHIDITLTPQGRKKIRQG